MSDILERTLVAMRGELRRAGRKYNLPEGVAPTLEMYQGAGSMEPNGILRALKSDTWQEAVAKVGMTLTPPLVVELPRSRSAPPIVTTTTEASMDVPVDGRTRKVTPEVIHAIREHVRAVRAVDPKKNKHELRTEVEKRYGVTISPANWDVTYWAKTKPGESAKLNGNGDAPEPPATPPKRDVEDSEVGASPLPSPVDIRSGPGGLGVAAAEPPSAAGPPFLQLTPLENNTARVQLNISLELRFAGLLINHIGAAISAIASKPKPNDA